MVNNRVFEVLSCGAVLISDCFPALEELLGEHVLCAKTPDDVTRHLRCGSMMMAFLPSLFNLRVIVYSLCAGGCWLKIPQSL